MLNQRSWLPSYRSITSNLSSHRAVELGSNLTMEVLGCPILFKNEISVHIVL